MKSLYAWSRKIHRWLAVPAVIIVPLMVVLRVIGSDSGTGLPKPVEMAQSFIMLGLVITGVTLYLVPKLIKRQRAKK